MFNLFAPPRPLKYSCDFTAIGTLRRRNSHMPSNGDKEPTFATEFYINDETISDSFGRAIDPLYADWIDVALATYMADRMSPRRDLKSPDHCFQWARRMSLKIPIRLPEVWARPEVSDALRKALSFFTDDDWHIEFVTRHSRGRLAENRLFLFPASIASPLRVALLSGGLDSFAGASQAVADFSDHSFVFVSGVTNSRQRSAQQEQMRALRRLSRLELCHIAIPFGISRYMRSRGQGEEPSQRTRGFLFLTFGAVTALTAGVSELYVHENGVGAINLPYNATQIGTSNSRGVHPFALLRMSELAQALTGSPFFFHNPFLYETKGQMCQHPAMRQLTNYIRLTFSCDGFPIQARGKPQCGFCTSCLLRRVSLEAAGLSAHDPSDHYVCDLSNPAIKASEKQLQHLNAMEWQFRKISRRLRSSDPWRNLVTEFTDLQSIALEMGTRISGGEEEVQRLLLQMYTRYADEWDKFSARGRLGNRARVA
ncbi:MAG: hypothetical protein L0229_05525 [Blastocatellia bacterium]|nr:hypothetical protein [Blastocatellia bacterium]